MKFVYSLMFALLGCLDSIASDYILHIGDESVDIDLNAEQKVTLKNGKTVTLKLKINPIWTYKGNGFSFQFNRNNQPICTENENVTRIRCDAGKDSTIIIEDIHAGEPAEFLAESLKTISDDQVEAGLQATSVPASTKLKQGLVLTGKDIDFQSIGIPMHMCARIYEGKNKGLLIIAYGASDVYPTPEAKLFWDSLQIDVEKESVVKP
jgi:hypothetical protein